MKKKVFVFLPDGVGLRNFAFTNFKEIAENHGFELTYWNNTVFPLQTSFGFNEVRIENHQLNPKTTIFSRARKRVELSLWTKKFNDAVYPTYNFPQSYKGLKNALKSLYVDYLVVAKSTEKGLLQIRDTIKKLERENPKYEYCKKQLQEHKPELVFCTNQRPTQAIAPLLAAQDIGIPTATFIFSWDNLPKATMVVETDYYFVWSELMKAELLNYYPYIPENQVFVTGTPQFEPHFDAQLIKPKEVFFEEHDLDTNKKYICYSGDDVVTSPLDQFYLEDVAQAVEVLNSQDHNLGIIFRKAPVDVTGRFNPIIEKYKHLIVNIDPLWEPVGEQWNEIMPTKADFGLLVNISHHCELVANVASSMVFDFVVHNRPCIYFDYEQPQLKPNIRDIGQNYKYVHFRSMPSKEAVAWAYSKEQVLPALQGLLDGGLNPVKEGKKWFEVIAGTKPTAASRNICDKIAKIIN